MVSLLTTEFLAVPAILYEEVTVDVGTGGLMDDRVEACVELQRVFGVVEPCAVEDGHVAAISDLHCADGGQLDVDYSEINQLIKTL